MCVCVCARAHACECRVGWSQWSRLGVRVMACSRSSQQQPNGCAQDTKIHRSPPRGGNLTHPRPYTPPAAGKPAGLGQRRALRGKAEQACGPEVPRARVRAAHLPGAGACVCVCVCVPMRACVCAHACVRACVRACVCACVCLCLGVNVGVWVWMCEGWGGKRVEQGEVGVGN